MNEALMNGDSHWSSGSGSIVTKNKSKTNWFKMNRLYLLIFSSLLCRSQSHLAIWLPKIEIRRLRLWPCQIHLSKDRKQTWWNHLRLSWGCLLTAVDLKTLPSAHRVLESLAPTHWCCQARNEQLVFWMSHSNMTNLRPGNAEKVGGR